MKDEIRRLQQTIDTLTESHDSLQALRDPALAELLRRLERARSEAIARLADVSVSERRQQP